MEINSIELRGIATEVSTIYINRRTYHTFVLNCAERGVYRGYVRHEDTEYDVEDSGHYCACGMEVSEGVIMATSVDRWGRICDVCGKWHAEGYWVGESGYACSEECAISLYNGDADAFHADLALLDDPETADDAVTYWTEWD